MRRSIRRSLRRRRFFDLPIEQVACDLPTYLTGGGVGEPLTEVGGRSVKVEVEAVAGKDGKATRSQDECQRMDDGMRQGLGAWADLERGDQFGDWVESSPHPESMCLEAQGGEEFVQWEMAEGQVVEEVSVDLFRVLPGAGQPQANGYLGMVEEQGSIGEGQAQVDGQEDLGNLNGGSAETIQGSAAPTGKAFAAGLTTKPLDAVRAALAITDEGMKS
jgi:hypothetical protein